MALIFRRGVGLHAVVHPKAGAAVAFGCFSWLEGENECGRGLFVTLGILHLNQIGGLFREPKTMPREVVHKR